MRLFGASVAVALVACAVSWSLMPTGEIPVHFGAGGEPDNWGTRNELVGIVTALVVGLAVFCWFMSTWVGRASMQMVNIPRKDYWGRPENEARARARVREDMFLVGVWTMWFCTALMPPMVVSVRTGRISTTVTVALVGPMVALTVLLVVVLVVRQRFFRRIDSNEA